MATDTAVSDIYRAIDAVWRIEQAKLIATLARIVRDVGLAEELAQDALVTALERLQLPMLSGATRAAMKASPGALDELRALLETPQRDLSPA